jgi:DNA helicase-2/ATP-dependent DNA helicase PcrA
MLNRSASSPDFTIHDREDRADLMNLVRHDLGFSAGGQESHFPTKNTCLAIYSRVVNAEASIEPRSSSRPIPGCWSGRRS